MPHPHLTVETSPDGAGRGAGVKAVMAAGGLLDRLRAERSANRSAWARVTAAAPSTTPSP